MAATSYTQSFNPILTGLFQEFFASNDQRIGTRAAPIRRIEGIRSDYLVPKLKMTLRANEAGYDPMVPLSWTAPSRPVDVEFEKRVFDTERYAEHYMLDDKQRGHFQASGSGVDPMNVGLRQLVALHAARHNRKVCQLYATAGNYGASDTSAPVDFTDGTADIITPLEAGKESVSEAAIASGGQLVFVCTTSVARALTQHPDIKGADNPVLTYGALEQWFQDQFGASLLINREHYLDNSGGGAGTATNMLSNIASWARVDGGDTRLPSFCHTVVQTDFDEDTIAEVWTDTLMDPRGEKLIAESIFKVEAVNEELGYLYTNPLNA